MNKISKLFLSAVMATSLVACGQKASGGVSGEFSGTAKGMGGDVTVTITLKDSVITDVKEQCRKPKRDLTAGKAGDI